MPLAWWLGWLSMDWLYFVGFVIGAVNTTAGSAAQIVLTQIVPRERLVEAHAKNALASSTAEVTGPGAAGALIKVTGAPLALLADALLLLISATILRGVAVKETPSAANAAVLARDARRPEFRARPPPAHHHGDLRRHVAAVQSSRDGRSDPVRDAAARIDRARGRIELRGLGGRHGLRQRHRVSGGAPPRAGADVAARHCDIRIGMAVARRSRRWAGGASFAMPSCCCRMAWARSSCSSIFYRCGKPSRPARCWVA